MSLLSDLSPYKGSTHYRKRLGRGRGSGLGQTSGKGHKGQLARTGGKVRRGFEGGQSPLMRRLPKFGFNNSDFRKEYELVSLAELDKLSGTVDLEALKAAGFIKSGPVKILANGELKKALTVKVQKFSKAAQAAIEAAGGKVEVIK